MKRNRIKSTKKFIKNQFLKLEQCSFILLAMYKLLNISSNINFFSFFLLIN